MALVETPYEKQPWEQRTLQFELSPGILALIDNGYTAVLEFKVFDSAGVDKTVSMVVGTPSITGDSIFATVTGGTDLLDYYGRIRLTLSKVDLQDEKAEWDFLIQVRQEGSA